MSLQQRLHVPGVQGHIHGDPGGFLVNPATDREGLEGGLDGSHFSSC